MRVVSAEETHRLLDYPSLIEALRALFRSGVDRAERYVLDQPLPGGGRNDWLLLPAWQFGRHMGIKLVSVYPRNLDRGIDSIQGLYLLFDGETGLPLAAIDGAALTLRKTAANSALAATYLAREDAAAMVMMGAGALGPHLVRAHCAVRPIRRVRIWNRTAAKAESAAATLGAELGIDVAASRDPEADIREADIVSCATMATEPVVRGAWLKPGAHVDLVGGFREEMREADDEAIRRARVFVDARFTAAAHAGDICQPLAAGLITDADITDTFELARGEKPGRRSADEITLFKSGGGGHEDLGTAQHLMARLGPA